MDIKWIMCISPVLTISEFGNFCIVHTIHRYNSISSTKFIVLEISKFLN